MIEVELSIGRDKVDGKPRPGNEVKKTLTIRGAILIIAYKEIPECFASMREGQIQNSRTRMAGQRYFEQIPHCRADAARQFVLALVY